MKKIFALLASAIILLALPSKADAQTIRDKYGSQIGKVDNDGTIRDKYGASIGSARGVPKTWAGLYFFFSLN